MVPMDEYPANHYPSFCSGSGFIISRNASERLFETARITDNFRFPDVHLTGILRLKSKLPNPVETASGLFSFLSQKISSTWNFKNIILMNIEKFSALGNIEITGHQIDQSQIR